MMRSTLREYATGRGRGVALDDLEEGDVFRVDCHDNQLRVHSDAEFLGTVEIDAYDADGRHLPLGRVDSDVYLGYSQLTSFEEQRDAGDCVTSIELVE